MKSKLTKIAGVGLAIMLLTSLMVFASPASAGVLSMSSEKAIPKTEDFILAPTGVSITDMAVNGDTMYAATGNVDYPLFKSTDGGQSWTDLKTSTSFPTANTITQVAVAPDNADVVCAATSNLTIEYSTNGGSSWSDMSTPTGITTLNDIDVSVAVSGKHYLAVAGANSTPSAVVDTLKLDVGQNWTRRDTADGFGGSTTVHAVKFSPNFNTDKIIAAVTSSTTANVTFQVFRYEAAAWAWNGEITFFNLSDWGNGIDISGSLDSWADNVTAASKAMIDS